MFVHFSHSFLSSLRLVNNFALRLCTVLTEKSRIDSGRIRRNEHFSCQVPRARGSCELPRVESRARELPAEKTSTVLKNQSIILNISSN